MSHIKTNTLSEYINTGSKITVSNSKICAVKKHLGPSLLKIHLSSHTLADNWPLKEPRLPLDRWFGSQNNYKIKFPESFLYIYLHSCGEKVQRCKLSGPTVCFCQLIGLSGAWTCYKRYGLLYVSTQADGRPQF